MKHLRRLVTLSPLLLTLALGGCAGMGEPYAKMMPKLQRGGLIYPWPLPTGAYDKTASQGATGNMFISKNGVGKRSGQQAYQLTGEVNFTYIQTQDPRKADFDPKYPTKNRIWGNIKIQGVYGQIASNLYLLCDAEINGESLEGTFDNWDDRGVPKGSKHFSIRTNQAICTVAPMVHPPSATLLIYKNNQVVALARLQM